MTIIDNIAHRTPKFKYTPPPSVFKTTAEKDRYWDDQIRYINEGHMGLTGFNFFMCQYWKLKDSESTDPIRFYWSEDQEERIFVPLDVCWKEKQNDFLLVKRRECAWSTILAGHSVWRNLTNAGCTTIYTSADVKRINEFFDQKLLIGFDYLDFPKDVIDLNNYDVEEQYNEVVGGGKNRAKGKRQNTSTGQVLEIFDRLRTPIVKGKVLGLESTSSLKSARKVEGFRGATIYIDEIFMQTQLNEVRSAANATRMKGLQRVAQILMGGTCGEATEKGAKDTLTLIEDSEYKGVTVSDFLGYHGLSHVVVNGEIIQCTVNGYTNHKLAYECIEKERERLKKAKDKTDYYKFCIQYPLSRDELFMVHNKGELPPDIHEIVDNQYKEVAKAQTLGEPYARIGNISFDSKTPEFSEIKDGVFHILEEPKKGVLYDGGIDPIPFGGTNIDTGSKYANIICDNKRKTPVAVLLCRHHNPQYIAKMSIQFQKWYNDSINMMEMNRGGEISNYYYDWGFKDLLAKSPYALAHHLQIKMSDLRFGKGYMAQAFSNGASNIGGSANGYLLEFAQTNADKIRIKIILEQYLDWKNQENDDVLDALRGWLLKQKDEEIRLRVTPNKDKNKEVMMWVVEGGRSVLKKVNIANMSAKGWNQKDIYR